MSRFGRQPGRIELFRQGISVRAAAEQLNVSERHLHNALTGRVRPMPEIRAKLPKLLGVPLEELFTAEVLAKPFDASRSWGVLA